MKQIYFSLLLGSMLLGFSQPVGAQDLIRSTYVRSYKAAEVGASLPIPSLAQYDVDVYTIRYTTKGADGQKDTASGLIVYPVRPNTAWPTMVYQHGTASSRDAVPSRFSAEATIGLIGGTLGYVSVLPDYVGLGDSRGFHPYVHAQSEAQAGVDMLLALQQFAASQSLYLNGQLFLSGYSQGGHASMALHRMLEKSYASQFKVTAAAHMSGPYSISGETRARLLSDAEYFRPGYALYTMLSYNQAYHLYDSLSQFIRPPYLQIATDFFSGKETNLDSVHARLAATLIQEKGKVVPKYIFQDSVLSAIAANPSHPANLAMADNDVYKWGPKTPTRLFYCKADDQVVYTNSLLADSVMRASGATSVGSVDVGSSYDHGQCFQPALLSSVFFFSLFQNVQTDVRGVLPALPVRMFPNPASGAFYLDNLPESGRITIHDMSGRLLHTQVVAGVATEVSLNGMHPGFYVVRVLSDSGVWADKLIVR